MKITKADVRKIIKEEVEKAVNEMGGGIYRPTDTKEYQDLLKRAQSPQTDPGLKASIIKFLTEIGFLSPKGEAGKAHRANVADAAGTTQPLGIAEEKE